MPLTLWGNPILDIPTLPLTDADFGADLAELGDRMLKVMYAVRGVGLAAPQVGIGKRFFVYDCDGRRGLLANPVIAERSADLSDEHEGCLSVPGFSWPTPRAAGVVIHGRDAHGDQVTLPTTGYLARCMQHETDHLDGQLYLSRLGGRLGKLARREAKQASWYGRPSRYVPID
jgi:peptide deformylase